MSMCKRRIVIEHASNLTLPPPSPPATLTPAHSPRRRRSVPCSDCESESGKNLRSKARKLPKSREHDYQDKSHGRSIHMPTSIYRTHTNRRNPNPSVENANPIRDLGARQAAVQSSHSAPALTFNASRANRSAIIPPGSRQETGGGQCKHQSNQHRRHSKYRRSSARLAV